MKGYLDVSFDSPKWREADKGNVSVHFVRLGFKNVGEVIKIRMFDLLNLYMINNNRAEEMLLCIYHMLYQNEELDEAISNQEIAQYFVYRDWKKEHKILSEVTVADVLFTEDINKAALLKIFDGVSRAFYKSIEYDSRSYKYGDLNELKENSKQQRGGEISG